jgi:hypothetical protein
LSKIIGVTPNDDYTLLIEFEQGNEILFNMQRLIKTMPYSALKNLNRFKSITVEEKALCWQDADNSKTTLFPIRLTVDNILFAIRD